MKLRPGHQLRNSAAAFTLIEAVIACGILFIALFAILDVVTQNVRAAHSLNQLRPSPGMVAAELTVAGTNQMEVGAINGDFGELYPDYTYTGEINEMGTNGLMIIDLVVLKKNKEDSRLSFMVNTNFLPRKGNR